MEYHDLKEKTDDELVIKSATSGPYAELLRRNTEALKESSRSAERYSRVMIDLTLVLFVIAFLQLNITIFASTLSITNKFLIIVGSAILIFTAMYDLKKDRDE